MTEEKREYRILLIVETAEEAKDVGHILRKGFSKLITTAFRHEAVQSFMKIRPDLLMVSCNEIHTSEEVICQIQELNSSKQMPHSLLLCQTSESEQAYKMMLQGIVDNFVADRPLYDPYSVIGAVTSCFKDIDKFRELNNELRRLNTCINDIFESGDAELKHTIQASISTTNLLSEQLGELTSKFHETSRSGEQLDAKHVVAKLSEFQKTTLNPGQNNLKKQLKHQANWLKKAKTEYSQYYDVLNLPLCQPERINALIVDDDEFFREAVATMLEETNITVTGIEGVSSTIQYIHEFRPDVILLDYEMPELDGIEVLKRLKAEDKTATIPVIMLTGFNSREIVNQSIGNGASDFIVKPGSQDVLVEKIQRCSGIEVVDF